MPTRAKSRIRPPIKKIINELKSWLPNYDHGPTDYPTILLRLIAALPGGDALEDAGYEPLGNIGWHEADQLGRVLTAIQDKQDVEDIARELLSDNEEELEEGRGAEVSIMEASRRQIPRVKWNQQQEGNAHVSDGQEGYWATFPRGTSAQRVLDTYMATADYSGATGTFTVTATIDGDMASVRVGPGGEIVGERHTSSRHSQDRRMTPVRRRGR